MSISECIPMWPQIWDSLEINEDCLLSAWLTGSFVNTTKKSTQESDVDVVLAFEIYEAIDEFDYDGRYPETIEVGGINRELDLIIGGPESDYDDSESELLSARPNEESE